MSKDENKVQEGAEAQTTKAPKLNKEQIAEAKAKEKAEKAEAKAKEKEDAKAKKEAEKANKAPGVILSILLAIKNAGKPVTEEEILSSLVASFPDRPTDSMNKTIKAQLGGKQQPTRMEKERGVIFKIEYLMQEVTTKVGEGENAKEVKEMVPSKTKTYSYVGEVKA